jgi:DNA replication and repair protein RecF
MSLERIDVHNLRNIKAARLDLNARFNVFSGPNGSGKTSLLESIYLLGSGHSFRSRETRALVTYDEDELTVFGTMAAGNSVSIQKSKTRTLVRLNQKPCRRCSDLARHFPCQVFYQDIFDIMDAGPLTRRSLLDWGLFHVKPDYHTVWDDYRRVLKHRNALLKQGARRHQFVPWDEQLVELSYVLDAFRVDYFKAWALEFDEVLKALTPLSCKIAYEKGWDKNKTGVGLDEVLAAQFEMDSARQYTHSGAHHADIIFETSALKSKQTLSRGQQKIILIALKLAQAALLPHVCSYILDDITAELDRPHVERLFNAIHTIEGQFFFTSIEPKIFKESMLTKNMSFFELLDGSVSRET